MKTRRVCMSLLALLTLFAATAGPVSAQTSLSGQVSRRQKHKNEWRNIAIGAGALALIGILKKDSTLTFAGVGGALYSLNRYEQDRKSQSRLNRARAAYFHRRYFYRNGHRYVRRTILRHGRRYYQFVRVS